MRRGLKIVLVCLVFLVSSLASAAPQPCSSKESVWRAAWGRWRVENCRHYAYDERGLELSVTYDGWCDRKNMSRTDFTYDGDRLESTVNIDLETNTREGGMNVSFNADGTERERCYWGKGRNSSCWRNVYVEGRLKYTILDNRKQVTEYTYGKSGDIVRELMKHYKDDGELQGYYLTTHSYHEPGKVSCTTLRRYDKTKRLYGATAQYFDRDGRRTLERESTPSGNNDTRSEYRYKLGEDGRLLESWMEYFRGTARNPSMVIRNVYGYECSEQSVPRP